MTSSVNSQQPQNVQVPNYSGVNIQIFNPSVNTPGSYTTAPTINTTTTTPSQPTAYPSNYYTNSFNNIDSTKKPETATPATAPVDTQKTNETKPTADAPKTEKRDVVQLTDDYIKNLEAYLNSQNTTVRAQGANEVLSRFKEDDSRKSDPALNALLNKMLQDPSTQIRIIGMSALQSGIANGNDETVQILKNMQNSQKGYGDDALTASDILLKMSANGNKVQKEFEVKDNKSKDNKLENSKTEPTVNNDSVNK